jgi:hypothetical protein
VIGKSPSSDVRYRPASLRRREWNALFQSEEKFVTLPKQTFIEASRADVCAAKQPACSRKRPFEDGNG